VEWRRLWLGLAAAAAVILAVAVGLRNRDNGSTAPSPILVELDDLDPAELELVLDAVPAVVEASMPVGAVGMSDLSTSELERVLSSWEG
jgi:hypothetical protein